MESQASQVVQHLRQVLLQDEGGATDGQLLECFIEQRDEAAFAAIVKRHGRLVWNVCRRFLNRHDTEDAFQATFLVLCRKAASIRRRESLASWLYGVTYHTALHARRTAARRRARQKQVVNMPEPAVVEQDLWNDLQPVLDQELSRLPEDYRVVVLLCDLESKTRKEVARQLRLPEATVGSRLARARAMLAKRLARHGLAVSGATLAVVLSEKAMASSVPTSVVSTTIKAVGGLAAGTAATRAISVKVAALTEGVMKAMLLNKLNSVVAGLLLVAVLVGGTGVVYRTQAAGPTVAAQPEQPVQHRPVDGLVVRRVVQAKKDSGKEAPQQPKEQVTLKGHTNRVDSLAFNRDGKTLTSASADGTIKLWDVTKDRNTATLKAGTPVACVAFNRDGKTLASGGNDSNVKLWDVTTGNNTATIQAAVDNVPVPITCVAFSPNGKTLASGSENRKIELWDVSTRKSIATLEGHTRVVLSVAFSPDSKTLASASGDGTIKLWDVAAAKCRSTLRAHMNTPQISYVYCVAFSPDGKTLASGGQDGTVRLWDVDTGKNRATLNGHLSFLCLAFSPDGKTLASGSDDRTVKLWDVTTGKNIATLQGHSDVVASVAFSPDGKTLASGSCDKAIKLWRFKRAAPPAKGGKKVDPKAKLKQLLENDPPPHLVFEDHLAHAIARLKQLLENDPPPPPLPPEPEAVPPPPPLPVAPPREFPANPEKAIANEQSKAEKLFRAPKKMNDWHNVRMVISWVSPWRYYHGQASRQRCFVGADRTLVAPAQAPPFSLPGAQTVGLPQSPDGHYLCPQDRYSLGGLAPGDGLRLRNDLPELPEGLAPSWPLAQPPSSPSPGTGTGRAHRLVAGGRRCHPCPGPGRRGG